MKFTSFDSEDKSDFQNKGLIEWAKQKANKRAEQAGGTEHLAADTLHNDQSREAIVGESVNDSNVAAENEWKDFSDQDLISHTSRFLGHDVMTLSQDEVTREVVKLLPELARRGISGGEFCFSLPHTVSRKEIEEGNSAHSKVYRSLFELSKTDDYENDMRVRMILSDFQNYIDQDPQMMGPVAMWSIAKEVLWQRDIDYRVKESLYGSMTYALSFFDKSEYSNQLLKQLDLENTDDYAEISHMLEAIKGFWSAGQESYAQGRGVSNFFVDVLKRIEITPESNFLLSLRTKELSAMLAESEEFLNEGREKTPFEISKGQFASNNTKKGLAVVPISDTETVRELIEEYEEVQDQLMPPQWMVDEAFERGDRWVSWMPPDELSGKSQNLFTKMHSFASVPVSEVLLNVGAINSNQKAEQLIFDYEYLVSRPMRQLIQKEFEFELKDLSIPEQVYFLNYLKSTTVSEADTMKQFTATYRLEGMRTFLALERGADDLGDKIVAFGQLEKVASKVFGYYCELIDIAERAEELVKEKTSCEGQVCIDLATQVRENILNRAQKDLEDAVRAIDPGAIEAKIQNYVAEAKEYVAVLQELGMHETERVPTQELSEQDKSRMLDLLDRNYATTYNREEESIFRETIRASLEKSFSNPDTEFYVLRDKEIIISFNRFDNTINKGGQKTSYFGSFNADPAYSGVGSVMLERTIQEQLEKSDVMYAHCDPASDIAKKYIESGFVAKETETVAGKFSFEIWRTKDVAEHLRSKQMSLEELIGGGFQEDTITVREVTEDDKFEELDEGMGYLLTRYFKHDGKTYAVFEIPSPTLWNQFQA